MAVDRDKVLQAAQKLVEKKRYDKAIVEYQKLVADDPKDVRTLLKIGDTYLKMEQHADAISTYERVGQFYSTQGFNTKAIAVYKQIREIIHKHVPHLEDRFGHIVPKLAETYAQLGLTSDALAAYDEVATRYQRAGRDRDAIDVFKKVVDLDPQNPLPHLRLAEAFMRVKDVDNAIQRFGAAAEILLKLGRRDDALKVVERLLQHRADARFARTAAEIYLERGEPSDAMSALSKLQICFKENPKDLETLALLARSFDKLNQPAKSIEVQKEAARIARDAGKPELFTSLVESLLARAPNDEGVRQLAALRQQSRPPATMGDPERVPQTPRTSPRPTPAPPPVVAVPVPRSKEPSAVELDIDEDVIVDEDSVSSAVPFALHPSHPPAPPDASVSGPGPEPTARVRPLLQQIDAYRRAKDYDHAIAYLFEAVEELPASRELREKLCDVLIEAGDQAEAVRQMLAFARWLAGSGDVDSATRILDEVLLLEPSQPDAIGMLRELGYTVQAEEPPPEYAGDGMSQGAGPAYDPSAPLPSYDLEEVGAGDAMSHGSHGRPFAASQLDDPFGEAPLPAFDLDDESTRYAKRQAEVVVPGHVGGDPRTPRPPRRRRRPSRRSPASGSRPRRPPRPRSPRPSGRSTRTRSRRSSSSPPTACSTRPATSSSPSWRACPTTRSSSSASASSRSTPPPPRARAAARAPSPRAPRPPPATPIHRWARQRGSARPIWARAWTRAPTTAPSTSPPPSTPSTPSTPGLPPDSHAGADPDQVSVESVFEQFKAGVAAQISESDATTHYDLGAAYKEMGLLVDAVSEFELAGRDPNRECVCHWMIGTIHREQGNIDAAIGAYIRGLHAQVKTPDQETALTYEIGDCYEERRASDQALYYFQRVARMSPGYADPRGTVADRVRRLEPAPRPLQPAAKAVGAETVDEFDAVLDDLLGGGKLP